MSSFCYDLHTHSCLSPCGDADNTPNNLLGMASISGIDILALTDHNTAKNCPAFFEAAERYGVIPVAGMELTTSEDIHVVCLFETLDEAMAFDKEIESRRIPIKNKAHIFGDQLIMDKDDNVTGIEELLLTNATTISIEDAPTLVKSFGGVCYPAHIDRVSNGIITVLGAIPPTPHFDCIEIRDPELIEEYKEKYGIGDKTIITSSDAHRLTDIKDGENPIELDAARDDADAVRRALMAYLGKKI
jgi:hypothetical protein